MVQIVELPLRTTLWVFSQTSMSVPVLVQCRARCLRKNAETFSRAVGIVGARQAARLARAITAGIRLRSQLVRLRAQNYPWHLFDPPAHPPRFSPRYLWSVLGPSLLARRGSPRQSRRKSSYPEQAVRIVTCDFARRRCAISRLRAIYRTEISGDIQKKRWDHALLCVENCRPTGQQRHTQSSAERDLSAPCDGHTSMRSVR